MKHVVALVLVASASACGDAEPCERIRLCDIRKPGCQQRVARVVSCLRQEPEAAAAVQVTVVDAASFIETVVAEPVPDEERVAFERWNAGLALYRLAPSGTTLSESTRDSWARVAGFYDTDTKDITILDRGYSAKSLSSVLLLAHETVHALQDASGVFDRALASARDGLDGGLAARAMSEGEADLLEDLTYLRASRWKIPHDTWDDVFDRWKRWAQLTSRNSLQPVNQAPLLFPYAFGSEYVRAVWRAGSFAAVDAQYDAVPESAFEVRGGFGKPPPSGGWIDDLGELALPVTPPGYERIGWDRFGWWILDAFCAREGISSQNCPGRLRDDTFTVFYDSSDDTTAALWRLRFESEAAAAAFAGAIPEPYGVEQSGGDVALISVSSSGRESDFASLSWTAVPTPQTAQGPTPSTRILCPLKEAEAHR